MGESAGGGSGDGKKYARRVGSGNRDGGAENGTEMKSMKWLGVKEEDRRPPPAATPTARECGKQASMQNQQRQQQQQRQPPPCSKIKPPPDGVEERPHISAPPPQPLTDMTMTKTTDPLLHTFPNPVVIARKPVVRKPVPHRTKKANSDVLRVEVKNTALETFLLLFAIGAFGACTVCFVVTELLWWI